MHGQLRENGEVYDLDERAGGYLCAQGLAVEVDTEGNDVPRLDPEPEPAPTETVTEEKE